VAEDGGDNPARPTPGEDASHLSRAVARGDRAALEAFYRAWFDRCYAAAARMTGRDEAFCLDVVQEAMLKVVRSIKPMRSEAELSAWMGRVVRSAAIDLIRKEARLVARGARAGDESERSAAAAWGPALEREQAAWANEAMAGLGADDRVLLVERFGRGRSLEEAGAAAGMSGGAAHGRLRRAVAKLKLMAREVFDG
jgi:RNA polymerase sigma factor (sigma-70 family)